MAISAEILCDSMAPSGKRMTTYRLTLPRPILAEANTHRQNSRNAGSSRAIPVERILKQVEEDPFVPLVWGLNQPGMVASVVADCVTEGRARAEWLRARDSAVIHARRMLALGLHKQVVNRLLEPWMWVTVIFSGTEFDNLFHLRCAEDAEPHFQVLAREMRAKMEENAPRILGLGEWHLPLVDAEDSVWVDENSPWASECSCTRRNRGLALISAGRCAAVSYHRDDRRDPPRDVDRAWGLIPSGHWSPLEHQAEAVEDPDYRSGNLWGWRQFRHMFVQ